MPFKGAREHLFVKICASHALAPATDFVASSKRASILNKAKRDVEVLAGCWCCSAHSGLFARDAVFFGVTREKNDS